MYKHNINRTERVIHVKIRFESVKYIGERATNNFAIEICFRINADDIFASRFLNFTKANKQRWSTNCKRLNPRRLILCSFPITCCLIGHVEYNVNRVSQNEAIHELL